MNESLGTCVLLWTNTPNNTPSGMNFRAEFPQTMTGAPNEIGGSGKIWSRSADLQEYHKNSMDPSVGVCAIPVAEKTMFDFCLRGVPPCAL